MRSEYLVSPDPRTLSNVQLDVVGRENTFENRRLRKNYTNNYFSKKLLYQLIFTTETSMASPQIC